MSSPTGAPTSALALYALLLTSAVLGGVGDILIFKWAKTDRWPWLAGGVLVWVVSLLLMGWFFRFSELSFSVAVVLLIAVHLLIDVAWDVGATGTRLTRWEWLGAACAVAAVLLIQFGKADDHAG